MASSVDITFASWDSVCWDIKYDGTGTISVSREVGKSTAKVTGTAKIYAHTGDQVGWKLHMKVGDNEEVTADFQNPEHWAIPVTDENGKIVDYKAPYDTTSVTQDVDVENVSGSLYVQLWVTVEDGNGTKSSVYSGTVTYDSIGIAKINSCSNMTIDSAVNIGWTAYSTSMYYWFRFECGSFSAWSDRIIVSSTEAQTFTNYTVPASIASSMSAWSTSDNIKVSLVTYSDYDGTKEIGRTSTTVKVSTTQGQAATIQPEWTLKETNTNNPFRQTKADIGGDGTYRFVKNISQLKLTVYAYSAYGSIPTYLSGEYYGQKFSDAEFKSTGRTVYGYPQYKAEITFTPKTAKSDRWWWFSVKDSREYITPVVGNGIFSRYYYSDGGYYYLTMNVADYTAPQITALKANLSGTVASVVASTVVTNVTNTSGTSINSLTATLTRKKTSTGESKSTNVISKLGLGEKSGITLASDNLSDLDSNSYEYTLTLTDKYTSVSKTAGTGVVALSFYKGGKGAAFFKEATTKGLDINGIIQVKSAQSGNNVMYIAPNDDNNYLTISFATPTQDVSQSIEFRNVGSATPELIGWDDAHGCYTFRASYQAFYTTGCLIATKNGQRGTEYLGAYYNTTESMLEFQNIGHTEKMFLTMDGSTSGLPKMYIYDGSNSTTLAAINKNSAYISPWKGIGGVNKPVYFEGTYGMPKACDPLSDMFQVKQVELVMGTASNSGGTTGQKDLDVSSYIGSNWKAIAIAGYYVRVWNSTSSSYDFRQDVRIAPSELYLGAAGTRLYCVLVNEGSTDWYTKIVVNLLCIYTL